MLGKTSIVLSVLLTLTVLPAFAKPAPPANLNEALEHLAELEESFENDQWKKALESSKEVEQALSSAMQPYVDSLPATLAKRLKLITTKLNTALNTKAEEEAEKQYIQLQLLTFEVMDHFEYKVHPLLTTLEKYIADEALEALKKNDYEDVLAELHEVASFFQKSAQLLNQHGVSREDLNVFRDRIGKSMQHARDKEAAELKEDLSAMASQIETFQASFH